MNPSVALIILGLCLIIFCEVSFLSELLNHDRINISIFLGFIIEFLVSIIGYIV